MATTKRKQNSQKFTREYKVKEIQRSINQKAKLKRSYLKALKEEGYSIPEKHQSKSCAKLDVKKFKEQRKEDGKRKLDEKKEIKKQRKALLKEDAEARRKMQLNRIRESKEKYLERERKSKRLTQMTRTGQPLMGPRIEDLLDKIKNDETYIS